ncbi:hypothetical protein FLSU104744_16535 [Flavobacterium succinicans]
MPKSRVTCVIACSDTSEKHQSSSVPIFQSNVGNFSTFQFRSLFSFLFVVRIMFSIKTQKKARKIFPLSVFRKVIHICFSSVFRFQILGLLCVGSLASSLLLFQLQNVWLMSAVSFQRSYVL